MNKFKSKTMIVLSAILALSMVLAACGSKNNEGGASPSGSAGASGSPSASKGKPVELIWYTIGTPQRDIDKVMAEVSKYTADKIGVTVTMKQLDWGDYDQKMKVMTASGDPMDIMFTASWAFDYVQNARKGAFMQIDDLLKTHGQGIVDSLNPAFLEGSKVDGHNYGVPANKELPALEVWRFNKDLLDKHNLTLDNVTTSLDSLEPLLKVIKEKEPEVTPFAINKDFGPWIAYDYIIEKLPMAVKLDSTDLKIVNIFETPELKDALNTMHRYYKAGYISAEAATTPSTDDLFKSGKWFTDRAATVPFADNLWTATYGYPVISKEASQSTVYNWSVMGSLQAISANSKYPEKAMEFLNLLNTDPYLRNLVDSGIEGVHYEKVSENMMRNLDEAKNYDMPTFSLGNVLITYLNEGDPENKWDEYETFNSNSKNSPILGFNFDTTSVATELASVQNVKAEFWSALMTGTVNPDEYLPKAIEKFKAAGLDKIIAEAQRQLDEWKAAK